MVIFCLLMVPVVAVLVVAWGIIHIARNINRIPDPAQRAQARNQALMIGSAWYLAHRYPEAAIVAAGAGVGAYMGGKAAGEAHGPSVTYNVGPVYVVNVEHWGTAPSTPYPGQWRL